MSVQDRIAIFQEQLREGQNIQSGTVANCRDRSLSDKAEGDDDNTLPTSSTSVSLPSTFDVTRLTNSDVYQPTPIIQHQQQQQQSQVQHTQNNAVVEKELLDTIAAMKKQMEIMNNQIEAQQRIQLANQKIEYDKNKKMNTSVPTIDLSANKKEKTGTKKSSSSFLSKKKKDPSKDQQQNENSRIKYNNLNPTKEDEELMDIISDPSLFDVKTLNFKNSIDPSIKQGNFVYNNELIESYSSKTDTNGVGGRNHLITSSTANSTVVSTESGEEDKQQQQQQQYPVKNHKLQEHILSNDISLQNIKKASGGGAGTAGNILTPRSAAGSFSSKMNKKKHRLSQQFMTSNEELQRLSKERGYESQQHVSSIPPIPPSKPSSPSPFKLKTSNGAKGKSQNRNDNGLTCIAENAAVLNNNNNTCGSSAVSSGTEEQISKDIENLALVVNEIREYIELVSKEKMDPKNEHDLTQHSYDMIERIIFNHMGSNVEEFKSDIANRVYSKISQQSPLSQNALLNSSASSSSSPLHPNSNVPPIVATLQQRKLSNVNLQLNNDVNSNNSVGINLLQNDVKELSNNIKSLTQTVVSFHGSISNNSATADRYNNPVKTINQQSSSQTVLEEASSYLSLTKLDLEVTNGLCSDININITKVTKVLAELVKKLDNINSYITLQATLTSPITTTSISKPPASFSSSSPSPSSTINNNNNNNNNDTTKVLDMLTDLTKKVSLIDNRLNSIESAISKNNATLDVVKSGQEFARLQLGKLGEQLMIMVQILTTGDDEDEDEDENEDNLEETM